MGQSAELRLAIALTLSAAVHLSLMFGIAARPAAPPSVSEPILARVVPVSPVAVHPSLPDGLAASRPSRRERPSPAVAGPRSLDNGPSSESAEAMPASAALTPAQTRLPTAELPVPADAAWYSAKDLDVLPRALAPLSPSRRSLEDDRPGAATLLVGIDETGHVTEVRIIAAEPDRRFGEAAVVTVQNAQFNPAQRNGRSVRSRVLMKVRFNPPESG